ncbi:MAG: hypothetical protein HY816_03795 [Candidatus Wallbacteria bacterium]|nr:hypothetical protein [Candidatus Wallbacteria bacterium]
MTVIRRADAFTGLPQPGTYTLDVRQTLRTTPWLKSNHPVGMDDTPSDESVDRSGSVAPQQLIVEVRADRLQPPEVVFRYPIPGTRGAFGDVFPHIVLRKGSWPWERSSLDADRTDGSSPWLGLIALSACSKVKLESGDAETVCSQIPAFQGEHTQVASWEKKLPCRTLEMDWDDFEKLAPRQEDLSRLAHVQQVLPGVDSKKPAALELEGSGRTPAVGPAGEETPPEIHAVVLNSLRVADVVSTGKPEAVEVQVHLVSFERRTAWTRPKSNRVRLLSLDHWSFTHTPGEVSTSAVLDKLRELTFGTLTPGQSALEREGFVLFGEGEDRHCFRGPLLPCPEEPAYVAPKEQRRPEIRKSANASSAVHDVSHVAAWEMGRLVALADRDLGSTLAKVRSDMRRHAARQRSGPLDRDRPEPAPKGFEAPELQRRLEGLWCLERVPLHYLIPDATMLLPEHICPFELDRAWADAWLAGALSAGRHSSGEKDIGTPNVIAGWRKSGPMGILLRSELVAACPNLTVLAERDKAPVKTLRCAKIAPDVLLFLAEVRFNCVKVGLPPEAGHYGCKVKLTADKRGSAEIASELSQEESMVSFEVAR